MAKCEKGYLCIVCGSEVEELSDSELYLRYTVGWLDPERLHIAPERHLTCNPALAQFIDAEKFANIFASGDSDKRQLDPIFVAERTRLLTRGYQRLLEIQRASDPISITEYPLPEASAKYRRETS
jgi:hypothetical protein